MAQSFKLFFDPRKACMFRCSRSTYEELVEMQQKAALVAVEMENIEYFPAKETVIAITKISNEERIQFVSSLKSELVKSTSTNFKLIGS